MEDLQTTRRARARWQAAYLRDKLRHRPAPPPADIDAVFRRDERTEAVPLHFIRGQVGELPGRIASDPDFERRFGEDPRVLFQEHGIDIPDELDVRLVTRRRATTFKPGPDFMPFTIELSNCRTFWVSDEPGGTPTLQTVCFGFRVTSHGTPPIA